MVFRGKGFTLIELLIAVVIMGLLLSLGLPALSTYSRNVKLRAAAESFMAGIQQARGEAVRLNSSVELILTNSTPSADDGSNNDYPVLAEEKLNNVGALEVSGMVAANLPTAHASTALDPSYNWLVRTLPTGGGACGTNPDTGTTPDPAQQAKACWFISGRRGAESGGGGSGADSDSRVLIEGPAAISFTPLGGASAASTYNFSYLNAAGTASLKCSAVDGGPIRCLRVRVELGGRAKLCDPAATTAGDTRGC
jgi:type IV fimbrial biogenesis protein FimT